MDNGRNPATIEITAGAGSTCDVDTVKRYEDLGVSRVMVDPPTGRSDLRQSFEVLYETLISKVLP